MEKVSASSMRLARTLVQSIASPALRPASRISTSSFSSFSSITTSSSSIPTALRRPCATAQSIRLFSSTSAFRNADQPPASGSSSSAAAPPPPPPRPSSASLMEGLADLLPSTQSSSSSLSSSSAAESSALQGSSSSAFDSLNRMKDEVEDYNGEFHIAIYSHKHNTHVTLSKPNGQVIFSVSTGNIGFKKSMRGSYDAAYQLGAFACDKAYRGGWHKKIHRLRVSLRGFGPGREALTKILLGTEGRLLRNKITQVADTTKLKFGGCRSPKKRRLG
ncbi:hypothetical protein Sste5346_001642 [Sporothrix stenoceras]|uniref:37S ribosomal protein n=1 Tax=Sporothrix stenoceras TaxID=5173 RepID=A0ABR3ZP45_9PEZI